MAIPQAPDAWDEGRIVACFLEFALEADDGVDAALLCCAPASPHDASGAAPPPRRASGRVRRGSVRLAPYAVARAGRTGSSGDDDDGVLLVPSPARSGPGTLSDYEDFEEPRAGKKRPRGEEREEEEGDGAPTPGRGVGSPVDHRVNGTAARWTHDEDLVLDEALRAARGNWTRAADHMTWTLGRTYTVAQVRNRKQRRDRAAREIAAGRFRNLCSTCRQPRLGHTACVAVAVAAGGDDGA